MGNLPEPLFHDEPYDIGGVAKFICPLCRGIKGQCDCEEMIYTDDTCPNCDGTGIEIVGFDNDWDVYENIEAKCPMCNGTGQIAPDN